MRTKQSEVLVFERCPNLDTAIERTREAIASTNVPAELRVVRVENDDDAKRLRFLGSPTVRVDGVDVDPAIVAIAITSAGHPPAPRETKSADRTRSDSATRRIRGRLQS